ncbi:MAG: hypothetical protein HQL48_06850 [Gammaproteobacteria bacterium]|nr:hypothetical protein [Gammaproteobacteria bacterium]
MELSAAQAMTSYQTQTLAKPAAPTPPPAGNIENRQPPAAASAPATAALATGVNREAMSALEKIVSSPANGSGQEMNSQLAASGLMEPGSIINTSA